jgi:hypothetical protein
MLRASTDKRRGEKRRLELRRQTHSLSNLLTYNHVHLKFGLFSMEKREIQILVV